MFKYELSELMERGEKQINRERAIQLLQKFAMQGKPHLIVYGLLKRESISFQGRVNPSKTNTVFINNDTGKSGGGHVMLLPLDEEGRKIKFILDGHSTYGDTNRRLVFIYDNNQYLEIHHRTNWPIG